MINEFTSAHTTSSSHYVIDLDGHAVKLVQEALPSFHAGWSFWQGALGVNQFSIGIEIVHSDVDGPDLQHLQPAPHNFAVEQYDALLRLVPAIRNAFPTITRQRVVGHSDVEIQGRRQHEPITHFQIGTSRLNDPGPMFEWERFERAHLARTAVTVGPPPAILYGISFGQILQRNHAGPNLPNPEVFHLKSDLSIIGYSVSDGNGLPDDGVFSVALERAVARFQRRFLSGARAYAGMPLGSLDFTTAWTLWSALSDTGP